MNARPRPGSSVIGNGNGPVNTRRDHDRHRPVQASAEIHEHHRPADQEQQHAGHHQGVTSMSGVIVSSASPAHSRAPSVFSQVSSAMSTPALKPSTAPFAIV